jgi:ArsR family transcriptional regulator
MKRLKGDLTRFRAKIFKALSDPFRLRIIEFLRDGEKCVCEIVSYLGIIQPVVSRHLKILKDCGLVKVRKDGNRRFYSVTDPRIFEAIDRLNLELVDVFSKRIIKQIV